MSDSLLNLAGILASLVFMASAVPMLAKAFRTKDLTSYSRGNLVLSNIGNAVYSLYVFSLPFGPIWLLHTFYVISSALMLGWSLRYAARPPARPEESGSAPSPAPGSSQAIRASALASTVT